MYSVDPVNTYLVEIIETIILIVSIVLSRYGVDQLIKRVLKKFDFSYQREQVVRKTFRLFTFLIAIVVLAGIWGLDHSRLLVFITSLFTVLGIAFFAQWSILSNITAGLILFFNHPLKLGDYIKIMDADPIIEGRIEDISFFFMHIITPDQSHITIPNAIVLQKTIAVSKDVMPTSGHSESSEA